MFECGICGKQSTTKMYVHTFGTEVEGCRDCFESSVKEFHPNSRTSQLAEKLETLIRDYKESLNKNF